MSSEKTEQPTSKKLREARKKGQVPKSKELATAAVILATGGALLVTGEAIVTSFRALLHLSFRAAAGELSAGPGEVLEAGLAHGVDAALPVILAAMFAGTMATFLQVGPLLSTEAIAAKLERLDVFKGIKNLFTKKQLVEFAKTLAKMLIVGLVAYTVLRDSVRGIVGLAGRDPLGHWRDGRAPPLPRGRGGARHRRARCVLPALAAPPRPEDDERRGEA